jgi:HMG-box domain
MSSTKSKSGKAKPNAFLFFMLEFRKNEARRGNEMDMVQVQDVCGKLWEVRGVSAFQIAFLT